MHSFLQDLRYGLRLLSRSPGFTLVAMLALALGIGANTAIFSVVNAVLLRPLPYHDPDRLVMLWEDATHIGFPRNTPAPANYVDWKNQNQVFEDLAAVSWGTFNLTGEGDPEKVEGYAVTPNLFAVLGVKPALGRAFLEEEDRPQGSRVVIVSHGLWKRRFGGDTSLVGRDVLLNGAKHTVVGVMPPRFQFPLKDTDVWVPIRFNSQQLANRSSHYLRVTARLKSGVTIERARADMSQIAQRLEKEYPQTNTKLGVRVVPLQEDYVGDVRLGLTVLLVAVGCVLLIACANLANLLLSRASGRRREIAVRTALGAGRARLIRQLLTENILLASAGGALGLLFSLGSFPVLRRLIPEDIAGATALDLDIRVLAYTLALSVLTGVLFGLAPVFQAARLDLNEALKAGGGRGGTGGQSRLTRNALVVSEVALALVLLIGAGLMLQGFAKLRGLDPGFRPENVLTMRLVLRGSAYNEYGARVAFFQQVLDRVRALPGVKSAGFTSALPLTWRGGSNSFTVEGRPAPPEGQQPDANNRVITPGFFQAMGTALRQGRDFDERDRANSTLVGIINETMARQYWPGESPLGKRFKIGGLQSPRPWITVVGVSADVRQMGLELPARAEMYFPYLQAADNWMVPRDLVIRAGANPLGLVEPVRREIWAVDRNQPISNIALMAELLDSEVVQRRVQVVLLGAFALLAVFLACLGIYGVLAYLVTQRTQEIGLRMALGAQPGEVLRAVVVQGVGLAALGIGIGLAGAFALTRVLATLLFGVSATDPLTFAAVPVLLLAVALLASYVPARRAARVDPMVALRYE